MPSPKAATQEKDTSGLWVKCHPASGIHWLQDLGQVSALCLRPGLARSLDRPPGHSHSRGPCRGRWVTRGVMAQGGWGALGVRPGGVALRGLPSAAPSPPPVPAVALLCGANPRCPPAGADPRLRSPQLPLQEAGSRAQAYPDHHPPLGTHGATAEAQLPSCEPGAPPPAAAASHLPLQPRLRLPGKPPVPLPATSSPGGPGAGGDAPRRVPPAGRRPALPLRWGQ